MKAEDVKNGGVYRVVSTPITSEDDERYISYKEIAEDAWVAFDDDMFVPSLPDGTVVLVDDAENAGTHGVLYVRLLFGGLSPESHMYPNGCYILDAANLHPLAND